MIDESVTDTADRKEPDTTETVFPAINCLATERVEPITDPNAAEKPPVETPVLDNGPDQIPPRTDSPLPNLTLALTEHPEPSQVGPAAELPEVKLDRLDDNEDPEQIEPAVDRQEDPIKFEEIETPEPPEIVEFTLNVVPSLAAPLMDKLEPKQT